MKQTEEKTNVMRTLDRLRIPYTVHHPNDTTNALSGVEIARQLNQPPERVFKTLVTTGHSGKHYVFIIPAAAELDLKKAAQSVREKSIAMLLQKELLPLTGYVHGGCSPIGMKKVFPTVLDASAASQPTIFVSAGKIGSQIELSPEALHQAISYQTADLTRTEAHP